MQSWHFNFNKELNDLRIIICLGKSEGTVERISICYVIEKNDEAGHTLYTNDVINVLL